MKVIKKILIIDDEQMITRMAAQKLRQIGFQAFEYSSEIPTLSQIEELAPDLIIVDYSMHGVCGHQLAQVLLQNPKTQHTPIIMMSAAFLQDSYKYFLHKPFYFSALHTMIQDIDMCINKN